MLNKSKKGKRKEKQCLEELIEWISTSDLSDKNIIATWKTQRSRAGGNDLFDAWDLAVLQKDVIWFVQVKSHRTKKEVERLKHFVFGERCYLGVYKRPKIFEVALPHFWLIKL